MDEEKVKKDILFQFEKLILFQFEKLILEGEFTVHQMKIILSIIELINSIHSCKDHEIEKLILGIKEVSK